MKKPVKYVGNEIALSVPISSRLDGPELAIRDLPRWIRAVHLHAIAPRERAV